MACKSASSIAAFNDVDLSDFGIFQRCWSGPDVPADPAYADQ